MESRIQRIELHPAKGEPPLPVEQAELAAGGLKGDRHCRDGEKQISVTDASVLEWMDACETPGICFRKFGANLVLDHLPGEMLHMGLILQAGEVLLRVNGVHKQCHAEDCLYFDQLADCRLRKYVLYCEGMGEGTIRVGDLVLISEQK
ncbi:MAG: MOSC domain-containing protein [Anaerovoracaceae bacterium]